MTPRRRGFSFIELLVALAILGILAAIAIPHYSDLKRRAIASQVLGDVQAIRIGTLSYFAERDAYPGDAPAGQVPTDLVKYLPDGMTFTAPSYTLDYDSYTTTIPGGGTTDVVTVIISSPDDLLLRLIAMLRSPQTISLPLPGSVTQVIIGI
jgi:prepilin-type N-terminal cleavage/methylation domain-containing protein